MAGMDLIRREYMGYDTSRKYSNTRTSVLSAVSDVPDLHAQGEELVGAMKGDAYNIRHSSAAQGESSPLFAAEAAQQESASLMVKALALLANSSCSMGAVLFTRQVLHRGLLPATTGALLNQACNVLFYLLAFSLYTLTSCCTKKGIGVEPPNLTAYHVLMLTPGAIGFAGMLVFNNLCLTQLSVIGYQLARSVNLPLTLLVSWMFLHQTPSFNDFLGVAIVTVGFFLGGLGNAKNNGRATTLSGIVYGFLGSACQCVYIISMKKCLPKIGNKETTLTFVTCALGAALLAPWTYIKDGWGPLFNLVNLSWLDLAPVALTIVCGCGVTFTTALNVRLIGPVALCMANYAKSTAQSVLSVVWMGETTNAWAASGLLITLGGSAWYTCGRIQSRRKRAAEAAAKQQV